MPTPIEPKEEFRSLDQAAIEAALADPSPNNPIAHEIARLIAGYSANFAEHCQKLGRVPTDFLRITPRWPIEAVAMSLVAESIQAELAD